MVIGAKSQRQDSSKRLLTKVKNADVSEPTTGDLWYNTAEKELKFCYNDSGSSTILIENQNVLSLPSGVIMMWSGVISDIPKGWSLCDGTNNTPDLTDSFVKSVSGTAEDPGTIGGNFTHQHAGDTHDHTVDNVIEIDNVEGGAYDSGVASSSNTVSDWDHSHSHDAVNHEPPYYEVAFIMKD